MGQSLPPQTPESFPWKDKKWMQERESLQVMPCSVYKVHPEFWRRKWDENSRILFVKELEQELIGYASDLGFHFIELSEPFHPSQWEERNPDMRTFIDLLHRNKLGFIAPKSLHLEEGSSLHLDGCHEREFVKINGKSIPVSSYLLDAVLEEMELGSYRDLLFPSDADPDTSQWSNFAKIRLALCLLYAFPGATVIPMAQEWGCFIDETLMRVPPWPWLDHPPFAAVQRMVTTLNNLQNKEQAFYEPSNPQWFEWVVPPSKGNPVISFTRKTHSEKDPLLVIANFGTENYDHFELGIPENRPWRELLNTDDSAFWGSGFGNTKPLHPIPIAKNSYSAHISLRLPALSCVVLKPQAQGNK